MKKTISIFLVASLALVWACSPTSSKYYQPTEANAKKAKVALGSLIEGKQLYLKSCGECHRLYKPSKYNAKDWSYYVDAMQDKAEISDAEKQKIYQYLTAEIVE